MNDISENEAAELLLQVQTAHRLCAGFYQRFLPALERIAEDAGFDFFREWRPSETSRPASRRAWPGRYWAWDLLPMYAPAFTFQNSAPGPAVVGDSSLTFHVYLEDSFRKSNRANRGVRGQPDPVELPTGAAVIDVALHRCRVPSGHELAELWNDVRSVESNIDEWKACGEHLEVRGWQVPVQDLLVNPEGLSTRIKDAMQDR
ncbi:hypothetical protein [Luteimonas sp. e5]